MILLSDKEFKQGPSSIKSIKGRAVTGVFSVFGNMDSYGDVMQPGSFAKTILERGEKIFHLWQHDTWSPAIAKVEALTELSQAELPDVIQRAFPEATGGAEVTRSYLKTPAADEILTGLENGVPYEMSFGFRTIKYDYEEREDLNMTIRNVREVKLYETSDVLWGANPATVATRAAVLSLLETREFRERPDLRKGLESILQNLEPSTDTRDEPPVSDDAHSFKAALENLSRLNQEHALKRALDAFPVRR